MMKNVLTVDVVLLLLLLLLAVFLTVFVEVRNLVALYLFLVRLPRALLNDCHILRRLHLYRWRVIHVWNDVVFNISVRYRRAGWFWIAQLWFRGNIRRVGVRVREGVEINVFSGMMGLHMAIDGLIVVLLLKVLRHYLLLNAHRRWMRAVVNLMIVVHHIVWRRWLNSRSVLFGIRHRYVKRRFTPVIEVFDKETPPMPKQVARAYQTFSFFLCSLLLPDEMLTESCCSRSFLCMNSKLPSEFDFLDCNKWKMKLMPERVKSQLTILVAGGLSGYLLSGIHTRWLFSLIVQKPPSPAECAGV